MVDDPAASAILRGAIFGIVGYFMIIAIRGRFVWRKDAKTAPTTETMESERAAELSHQSFSEEQASSKQGELRRSVGKWRGDSVREEKSGLFYLIASENFEIGDVIHKGEEEDAACLYASVEIDDCIAKDGWHGKVYRVEGVPCGHYWPMGVDNCIRLPSGGFIEGMVVTEELPPSVHQFDCVTVVEVITDEFFGPNGAQVLHLLSWHASKFVAQGADLLVSPAFETSDRQIASYYKDRLSRSSWPVANRYRGVIDDLQIAHEERATPTNRFWLRPSPRDLSKAWAVAYKAAVKHGRTWRCRWLIFGSPAFIAVALRDVLPPTYFSILYGGLEPFFPIATLDSEVRGVLYKA